jgi:hypothetical protein
MVMSKKEASSSSLHGKVLAFNISRRGQVEGALLATTTGLAQLNFPKHRAETLARSMRVGARVELTARLEAEDGSHPVFTASEKEGETSGTISRLNYALRGEVNGYHLDEGTFVHVKPAEARKYKLAVGDRIRVSGSRHSGPDAVVLEVNAIEKMGVQHADYAGASALSS